ncbi:MAG: helix-turn-helix domain-containing protein [Myxococcota bacterium]
MEGRAIKDAEQLGRLIRRCRRDLGLRQQEAAGLTGVGTRFFSELERGKPTVRLQELMRVLDRLGLELVVRRRSANEDEP